MFEELRALQEDQEALIEAVHRLAHVARLALVDHDLRTVRRVLLQLEEIE